MGNVKYEMADVSGINGSQEIHKIHSKSEADRKRAGGRGGTYLLPRTCCTGQIQLKCWYRAGKQLPPDPYRRPLSDMCAVWPIKELFAGTVRGKWQSGKAGGRWHTVGGRWKVAGNMGQSECCILFIQRAFPFGIHRESHAKKERDNSIVIKIIKYIIICLFVYFDFNEH